MTIQDYVAVGAVVVAIAGVAAAFLLVYVQHEDQKELMRIQVGIEMVKLYDSAEMRRARKNFSQALLKGGARLRDERVLDFFETLSLYFEQDRIDEDSVYVNFSYWIEHYWAASKDAVYAMRKEETDDELYVGFEDLSTKMAAHSGRQSDSSPLSKERIERFLKDEVALPQ
jgi:hypothetical protein